MPNLSPNSARATPEKPGPITTLIKHFQVSNILINLHRDNIKDVLVTDYFKFQ